eukprot:502152-Prymnesium_polylepis.2
MPGCLLLSPDGCAAIRTDVPQSVSPAVCSSLLLFARRRRQALSERAEAAAVVEQVATDDSGGGHGGDVDEACVAGDASGHLAARGTAAAHANEAVGMLTRGRAPLCRRSRTLSDSSATSIFPPDSSHVADHPAVRAPTWPEGCTEP